MCFLLRRKGSFNDSFELRDEGGWCAIEPSSFIAPDRVLRVSAIMFTVPDFFAVPRAAFPLRRSNPSSWITYIEHDVSDVQFHHTNRPPPPLSGTETQTNADGRIERTSHFPASYIKGSRITRNKNAGNVLLPSTGTELTVNSTLSR